MYKYSLDKKPIKHKCPQCEKKKLVLYLDNETDNYLSFNVGRCDREINCGYHFTPKSYFNDHNKTYIPFIKKTTSNAPKETNYHFEDELKDSLTNYNKNNFIQFLYSRFTIHTVNNMLNKYKIGTAESWYNGTIFWQIDIENKIRGGKIILYDDQGKRTKYINWVHSLNIKKNIIDSFNLEQCFFGEHLLSKYDKPVAVVESEKTACIMSLIFDKYLWIATGSLQGLNYKKIEVLKKSKIILYPDLGLIGKNGSPFTKWKSIYETLKIKGYDIQISDLLERNGTVIERENGFDIADYFIKNQLKETIKFITKDNQKILKMYMKNKSIKTLIEVFNLTDINWSNI